MTQSEAEFDRWVTWPDWARDAIVTNTDVYISWADLLRVIWHRRFVVTTKTCVPVEIGKTETLSRFSVAPIWRRRGLKGLVQEVMAGGDQS